MGMGIWRALLAWWVFVAVSPAMGANWTVPADVKRKYKHLYAEPVQGTADGGLSFHKGRLFHRGGVRVLSLEGDRFEMAFQHGRLLADVIPKGAVPQAALAVEHAVRNGFPSIPLVTGIIVNAFYRRVTEGMFDYAMKTLGNSSDEVLMDAYGLSEGSGLPLQTILYGALGPESLQVLLGERVPNPAAAAYASHCTDFAVWGSRTADGEVILGRNTDYPLNGSYDEYPTVLYFNPARGQQKFMSVASAGVHNAGVVGINESGIFLGVHSLPTTDVSTEGIPAFFIGQEVLRNARSIDEAVKLFRQRNPPSGWTYHVASLREKRSVSVELSNRHMGTVPSAGEFHAQSNHYRSAEMTPYYLHVNEGTDVDSSARLKRAEDLIQSTQGAFTVERAARILGDKVDPYTMKVNGFGNTIAVHTTLTSLVVEAGKNRIFVASGRAPVSVGDYVELPLAGHFSPADFTKQKFELLHNTAFSDVYPQMAKAEKLFIEAKVAYEDELDFAKSLRLMEEVLKLDGSNPFYQFDAAIIALKANERSKSVYRLNRVVALSNQHLRFVARYYLARLKADEGDKKAALVLFQSLLADLQTGEAKLKEATESAIDSCRGFGRFPLPTQTLGLMVQQADMLSY